MSFIQKFKFEILCALFVTWAFWGVFPLSCYETDAMHIIAGCNNYIAGEGKLIPPSYTYAYDMQPLVTLVVVGIKYVFAFLTCEQIYCLLTAIAAMFFAVGCMLFVCRVAGVRKEYALLSLFLIPETYACAYYPNTTTLAAALFVWGLLFLKDRKWAFAGLLLCISPLFRIDVLIVYPTILPLLILQGEHWKRAFIRSAGYAVVVVAFTGLGCWMLQANPLETLNSYGSMNESGDFAFAVKFAVVSFYTVLGVLLLPWGLVIMTKAKQYKLLFLCLVPMVLLHFMFRNTGCATKHYLYLLPFVSIIFANALQSIYELKNKVLKYGICGAVILFLVISIRCDLPQNPWRNEQKSESHVGPILHVAKENKTKLHLQVGIGAGQLIPTFDEYMLATGNLFYSFYIHTYKERKDSFRREAYELLKGKTYKLLLLSWGECSWYVNLLLEDGWSIQTDETPHGDHYGKLTKEGQSIDCYYTHEVQKNDLDGLIRVLDRHRNEGEVCVVEEQENMNYLLEKAARLGKIEKLGERCYLLK